MVVGHFVDQFIILFVIFLPVLSFSLQTDTLSSTSVIKDPQTLVSRNQAFKLGFFTPANTKNRYLGVFFEDTVVWVANRDKPLSDDSSSSLTISKDANLVLINARNQTVWSTNLPSTSPVNSNTTLQILDTGNLVLRDIEDNITIWESFSQPTNVNLPTMKLSDNTKTGKKVLLSSWKSATDPQVGSFTCGLEVLSIPQSMIWNNGRPYYRTGPWNGEYFIGVHDMFFPHVHELASTKVEDDHSGTFYQTQYGEKTIVVLKPWGTYVVSLWDDRRKSWDEVWHNPQNECDLYGKCGLFGRCNVKDSPICSCLRGFEPVSKKEWGSGNWTSGCHREIQLKCDDTGGANSDGFLRHRFMKVPDFPRPFSSYDVDECRRRCSSNCSCIAYAHEPNIGYMHWSDTLIDVQNFNDVGLDLYVRLASSELDTHRDKKLFIIIPVVVAALVCILVFIFIACCWMVKRKGKTKNRSAFEAGQTFSSDSTAIVLDRESKKVNIGELPEFSFETLANATFQFHENNLLGRGGFGPVYKGNLENGKQIAVKRLSTVSVQGMKEFTNEVIIISKLQHRNLVRLLGCCVEKGEKMLVYEFMPNKSLDAYFFDPTHTSLDVLDWTKRFSIIEGIGRGLLYLHKDSRLRIIHRDLKPSNVLLDKDWNPKISDFGMARIFGGNEDHGNTARVVGTYGYMAPEYATHGRFSEKSDVYSFGVLVLEIVKGQKNTHYYNHEWSLSLIGYAWKLWSEDDGLGFVEQSIASSDMEVEINRCIQIALLCVQEVAKDRPTIQTVLSMLSREIIDLPQPQQPVFAENWNNLAANQLEQSNNDLSLTVLDAR